MGSLSSHSLDLGETNVWSSDPKICSYIAYQQGPEAKPEVLPSPSGWSTQQCAVATKGWATALKDGCFDQGADGDGWCWGCTGADTNKCSWGCLCQWEYDTQGSNNIYTFEGVGCDCSFREMFVCYIILMIFFVIAGEICRRHVRNAPFGPLRMALTIVTPLWLLAAAALASLVTLCAMQVSGWQAKQIGILYFSIAVVASLLIATIAFCVPAHAPKEMYPLLCKPGDGW